MRKVYVTKEEKSFVAAGRVADLPVIPTPAGKLGVLVCADSWHPDCYEALSKKGCEILCVPVYLSQDGIWDKPWKGYTSGTQPPDVDSSDIEKVDCYNHFFFSSRPILLFVRLSLSTYTSICLCVSTYDPRLLKAMPG